MIDQVSKGSDWVKVTFEITLLTADSDDLNRVCDDIGEKND